MQCPRCNHEVGEGLFKCPDCGYELPDTEWPSNPNLFQGPAGHVKGGSARGVYVYLTAFRNLWRRFKSNKKKNRE